MRSRLKIILALVLLTIMVPGLYSQTVAEFWQDGRKRLEGYLDDEGRKAGIWIYWHKNGALAAVGNYEEGRRTGQWRYYHLDGWLHYLGEYEAASDSSGFLNLHRVDRPFNDSISKSPIEIGNFDWGEVPPDEVAQSNGDGSVKDGVWIEYDQTGDKVNVFHYEDGKLIRTLEYK